MFTQDGGVKALHCLAGNAILWRNCRPLEREQVSFQAFRCFSHGNDDTFPGLDRGFMARLWVSDIKKLKAMEKRRRHRKASSKHRNDLASSLAQSDETHNESTSQQQPPVSQSMSGLLKPTTSDEVTHNTLSLVTLLWYKD